MIDKNFDKISFISIIIPYAVLINWLLYGNRYFTKWEIFWKPTLILSLALIFLYLLITGFSIFIRKKFPSYYNALKRGILISTFTFIINSLLTTGIFWLFSVSHFLGYTFNLINYSWSIAATFIISILTIGSLEGAYAIEQWKEIVKESERLKKETLQKKLDKLKEQINPHFLFNCLNSLISLISEDPPKAGQFLNELTKVYRYFLHNNEELLTTLSKEIAFIHSYFHLLKTRHTGVSLTIEINNRYADYLIPPLTLQLLVENAIKHNVSEREKPLYIYITTTDIAYLSVINNKQLKIRKMPSTKVGLSNIKTRYELLGQPTVEIKETSSEFCVTIPLIRIEYEMV